MEEAMTTGDVVIGVLAAAGVIVLIAVFIIVFRMVFFSNDKDMLASSTHLKSWSGKMSKVVGLAALKDLAEAQEGELSFKEVAELLDGIGDAITEEHHLMMHSLASKILESLHTKAVGGETVRLLRCSLSLSLSCSRAIESR